MLARRQRADQMKQLAASTAEQISSGSEDSSAEDGERMETGDNASERAVRGITFQTPKRKRRQKTVVTPELAAALDRTKVSDRKADFVIAETAKSLGRLSKIFFLFLAGLTRNH